jgi:predicted DNA-binding transcriptional regulator AlpA
MSNILTTSQVAKAANVTRATIYNWRESGRMPIEPISGSKPPRYTSSDVCGWLNITPEQLAEALR